MGGLDPSILTPIGAAVVVALTLLRLAIKFFTKTQNTAVETIDQLRLNNLDIIKERDRERKEKMQERQAKHDALNRATAAEYALQLALQDIQGFLRKEGIDPAKFEPSSTEKIQEIYKKYLPES